MRGLTFDDALRRRHRCRRRRARARRGSSARGCRGTGRRHESRRWGWSARSERNAATKLHERTLASRSNSKRRRYFQSGVFFSVRAPTTSGAMRFFPLGEKRRSFALHLVSFPNPFPNPTWGRASWLYFFGVSGSSDSLRFFLRMLRNSTPDPTRASAATAALRKTLAISTLVHRVGRRSESTFTRFARESSKVA